MKQRQAVFSAVINVMGEQDSGAYQPTTEQRKQIIEIVAEGLANGEVDFSDSARAKYDDFDKIKGYTSGLVSNWLRKDPELNGGETYRPTNPGSRTGSQDEQVKAIRALIKSGKLDEEGAKLAQAKLDERLEQLRAEKNKVEININQLPADLREQLGL